MELTVGEVLEGKVKSLTKFGAFITLPDGSTGLVHISEVAYVYVNDIHDHLTEGDTVKVMVIGTENGKINLSIKRTLPQPQRPNFQRPRTPSASYQKPAGDRQEAAERPRQEPAPAEARPQQKSFDDMLKQFMTESDSRISSAKQYSDHKTKTRKR